jgi:hypothetical protein
MAYITINYSIETDLAYKVYTSIFVFIKKATYFKYLLPNHEDIWIPKSQLKNINTSNEAKIIQAIITDWLAEKLIADYNLAAK